MDSKPTSTMPAAVRAAFDERLDAYISDYRREIRAFLDARDERLAAGKKAALDELTPGHVDCDTH